MKYHGNYCGPNWSAGAEQPSVVSDVPPIDEFDHTCRVHDAEYFHNNDLLSADLKFLADNLGKGPKRSAAAAIVGGQAILRAIDKSFTKLYQIQTNETMSKPLKRLRGSQVGKQPISKGSQRAVGQNGVSITSVPAATGYQLGQFVPATKRSGNSIHVRGREYGCTVTVANNPNFGVAGVVALTPALFQSAMLGAHARCHEKYRFRGIAAHYVPAVPTSSQGQVMLLSSKNMNEPFINSNSASFLARGLTQSNSILTPIWMSASTRIACDDAWRNVDFAAETDYDDNILEEIQVYGWSDTAGTAGSIIIDYDIEFKDPVYQPHSASIPDSLGPGSLMTLVDDSAVNATTDIIRLTNASMTSYFNGTIFRCVFRASASTYPTGPADWGTVATVATSTADTTTTTVSSFTNITMAEGTTLFFVVRGATLTAYATIAAARNGGLSGNLSYRTATTAVGSWSFLVHLVSHGNPTMVTTQ